MFVAGPVVRAARSCPSFLVGRRSSGVRHGFGWSKLLRTFGVDERLSTYRETTDREDGLTLVFDGVTETLPAVAAFVERERECCAFATYRVEVAPPYEETCLTIRGPDGTVETFRRGLVAVLEGDDVRGESPANRTQ